MQKMLDFCFEFSKINEFEFNASKCKILHLYKNTIPALKLGGAVLEVVQNYKYLGVEMGHGLHVGSRPAPVKKYIERISIKATSRSFVVHYLGGRGDGLRPQTGLKLYKMLVRPIFYYGSPVLAYTSAQLKKLEKTQLDVIKRALGLRQNTKNETVRILSGIEPLEARFAFLKLKHLYRILQKPKNSLVRIIFNKISLSGEGRPGFLSECKELCKTFDIAFEWAAPNNPNMHISEFAHSLKSELYRSAFRRDLERIRDSNQAKILASLFPPNTTYYSYMPLDIMTRILHGKDRQVRTAFLQNLCGTSFLANGYRNKCHFCSAKNSTLNHYVFECPEITEERNKFFSDITNYIAKINSHLSDLWRKSRTENNRYNICSILFGGNYALESDNDYILFRKSHRLQSHTSDRTVLMTADFLAKLNLKVEETQNEN